MTKAIFKNSKLLNLELVDKSSIDILSYQKVDLIDAEGYLYYLSNDNLRTLIKRKGKACVFYNKNPYTIYNIQQWLNKNSINIYVISSEVINAITDLKFYCSKHKQYFYKTWNEVKNGSNCPYCGEERRGNGFKHTLEYIKEKALKDYNINIIEDTYINNETKMKFICNNHKEYGVQEKKWSNIISKLHPCIHCSNEIYISQRGGGSKGEKRIKKYLDSKQIPYAKEKTFKDLKGTSNHLRFDFYLINLNICIEFQGGQHYTPINYFGGEKYFNQLKTHDNLKREYCKANNIKLIEISYLDYKNIEKILDRELNDYLLKIS